MDLGVGLHAGSIRAISEAGSDCLMNTKEAARKGAAIRIGVNSGSLKEGAAGKKE
ncbi:MAG: hypothetical protein U5N58_10370 [Actinomycetota bacterium]|nr:hypothetical protein [Actinomycetota bacterium]